MQGLNHFMNESVSGEQYLEGLKDLLKQAEDEKSSLNTSRALKLYYENALKVGIAYKLIDNLLRKRINRKNKELGKLGGRSEREVIIDNLNFVIDSLENK